MWPKVQTQYKMTSLLKIFEVEAMEEITHEETIWDI